MKKNIIILFLIIFSRFAIAQEVPVTTQQQLENLADILEADTQEDDNYLQILEFYSRNPLNLNTATATELQPLRLITDLQIDNIIRYRNIFGKFIDIHELQAVPTLDIITIRKILPYVYVGPPVSAAESLLRRFRGGDNQVVIRNSRVLENQRGYDRTRNTFYLGDPNHVMFRYRYQFKNLLQFGLVADKDAGEQFLKGAQRNGFDFYSAHFFVRKLGIVKSLAIGDYLVNLGQGLTQWQSLAFGKSSEVMSMKRQSPVLMPYRSAGEFLFNRGAGVTLEKNNFEATAFISFKKFSGNYRADSAERFSSFQTSGFYRTPSEVADRYNMDDLSFGGNISYSKSTFKVGVNTVRHQFSLPLEKRADPYNFFAVSGKTALNSSVDYSYTYKNVHLFGEAAIDKNRNTAFVNGALISVDPKVDVSLFYREIEPAYQSLFGNSFTESTLPSNETGFYTGIAIRPVLRWQINAYADFYEFPFLRYRVNAPTRGNDYLVQLSYQPDKKSQIYLRYRTEMKPINESGTPWNVNFPVNKTRQNFRLHFATQVHPVINLRSRLELVWFDRKGNSPEEGFLTYIEGSFKPSFKFSGNLRIQYFETGGYNSRIYAYESDVLYSFSIPPFFDKGFRYYVNVNYDVSKQLSFWVRLAQTVYQNRTTVGSGLDLIDGKRKSDLKVQMRLIF